MSCGACDGDGFVEHPPASGAMVPCEFCRKAAYDRWCEGKYTGDIALDGSHR